MQLEVLGGVIHPLAAIAAIISGGVSSGMGMELPATLRKVLEQTPELGRAYLVGGCVRDWLLGLALKDYDVEVYGLSYENLARVLSRWGRVDLVGRSFGVAKLTLEGGQVIDFSVPRRDSKIAPGHKGFHVTFEPDIAPETAAARRDFTINAMLYDPRTQQLLDFFGGESDLRRHILRHTSEAFIEDPLRVLRGMQLAARFDLQAASETVRLCRQMERAYPELAGERVREEWLKWATRSRKPSAGLKFMEEAGWMTHLPELACLKETPQDPEWHPEGDVFVHTLHCCDALAGLRDWQEADVDTRAVLSFAVLTHDLGKANTTSKVLRNGVWRIVSPGHETTGMALAETFLNRIHIPRAMTERVLPLVGNHMAHFEEVTDRSVRRLSKRLEPETIEHLCTVMAADAAGRPPQPAMMPRQVQTLRARAEALNLQASAPRPILMGRHLEEWGLTPGRGFGPLLRLAYEQQLEGKINDLREAREWLVVQDDAPLPPGFRDKLRQM